MRKLRLALLLCTGLLQFRAKALAAPLAFDELPAFRGITVGPIESAQQPGRGYGTPYSAALLDELVRLGANAISITPFGRIWSLGSTTIHHDFEAPYRTNRAAIGRMVAQAKERGLRVLLIPHLWVETAGWRGELDPGSPERWAAYQSAYRDFILRWAENAAAFGVDAFSIGVECKSWSGRFGAYWTQLIGAVRGSYHGSLTYSANWDEVEDVLFWDQLDFIGVNAFYPLANRPGASDRAYARAAQLALSRLSASARALEKPVVLVEVGYTSRKGAAVEPWLWPDDMHDVLDDEREQARALAAIVSAAAGDEAIHGLFIWRYYSDLDDVSQEAPWGFSPHGKLAESLLAQMFGLRWASDPTPAWPALEPAATFPAAGAVP